MKVIFDLKELRVNSMDNAMINVGKNWIVMKKEEKEQSGKKHKEKEGDPKQKKHTGGEQAFVERMGDAAAFGTAGADAGAGESRVAEKTGDDEKVF